MKCLLALLVCLVPAVFTADDGWTSERYPDPMSNLNECGRKGLKSHICDPDQILSFNNANQIEKELQKLTNETKCRCSGFKCSNPRGIGFRMGIAIMKSMKTSEDAKLRNMINNARTQGEKEFLKLDANMQLANQFAFELLQKWQLGRCNDDLILLYSEDDNILFTFTSELTSKYLNPSVIADITMRHRIYIGPNRNRLEGLRGIIKDYKAQLRGEYKSETSARYTADTAALRSRRDSAGASHATAAILVTSVASILASLALH